MLSGMDEAELAGLRVMEVRDHTDRLAAAALLSAIWGVPPTESPVPADMMVALTHAGGCVLGAWTADDTLVGVAIGLAGAPRSEQVYSYIAGVAKGAAGIGVGRRLKLAQRDWALRQGATSLIWTYDPLIRRNAHFNLNRLGAAVTGFVPDYYPPMTDALNTGDLPDRFVVEWRLTDEIGGRPLPPDAAAAPVVLGQDAEGGPVVRLDPLDPGGSSADRAAVVRALVPGDIEALRARDPGLGRRWRLAAREVFGALFGQGFAPVAVDADGHYVFVREA